MQSFGNRQIKRMQNDANRLLNSIKKGDHPTLIGISIFPEE